MSVSYTHLDVYKRQSPEYPQTMDVMVTGAQLLDLGIVEDINAGGATVSIFDGGYTISGTGALTCLLYTSRCV